MDSIHTRTFASYRVLAEDAQIRHCRGVYVFYQDAPHFQIEAFQLHWPKVMIFHLAFGSRSWFIAGCYLDPNNT